MNHFSIAPEIRLRIFSGLVTALTAVYFGFVAFNYATAVFVLRFAAIPILLVGIAFFLYFGIQLLRRHAGVIIPLYRNLFFAIAFPLVAFAFLANQPLGYKTVMDEILLVGASQQIFQNGEPLVPTEALLEQSQVNVITTALDKRSLFKPLVVAAVHTLTGYRVANAFYLNVALTLLILAILWGIGFVRAGPTGGICGLLLAATLPLLAMAGTSGGFETLNLLFLLFLFLAMVAVYKDRDSASLSFLVATTVLLAQIRYESVIFVGITAVVVLSIWWLKKRVLLPVVLIIAPLLLLNIPWQNEIFEASPAAYQLSSKPDKETVFSLFYVPENLGHALNFFLSWHRDVPNSFILFLIGFPCLFVSVLAIRRRLSNGQASPMEMAALAFYSALLAHFFLMMLYFWGQYDDPIIFRLSLPTWILFWLATVLTSGKWASRGGRRVVIPIVLIFCWVIFTMPILSKHSYSTDRFAAQAFERAREWAEANRSERYFFISEHAMFWILEGFPGIEVSSLPAKSSLVNDYLEYGVFDEILTFTFFVNDPEADTGNLPTSLLSPPGELETEPFYRESLDLRGGFEIRRVTGLRDSLSDESEASSLDSITPPTLTD